MARLRRNPTSTTEVVSNLLFEILDLTRADCEGPGAECES
jgi:hypothetical protein